MMKKMILVTSPPACGKTYISKQLAKELKHVVYLDKDTASFLFFLRLLLLFINLIMRISGFRRLGLKTAVFG